ncbi:hypothetical protein Leryth_006106 [Lithospermum erythrorhizon]|nr:hypothetical protein Leryth_006106 [Lithospermum erythrorhizon]
MPINHAHQYNLPQQSSIVDATTVDSSVRPPNQPTVPETDAELNRIVQGPTPTYVQFQQQYHGVSHVQPQTQTIYTKADAEARKTVQSPTPTLTYVQVPHNQYQQQYCGASHVHPHTQTITTGQAATANYSYNYTHLPHDQLNYVHHAPPTPIPSQYQTITPATASLISQATSQLEADNASQQIQTSQCQ